MTILACMTIFSEEHGNEGSPPCTVGKKQWAAMHACVSTCMGTKITDVLQVGVHTVPPPLDEQSRALDQGSFRLKGLQVALAVRKVLQVSCRQSSTTLSAECGKRSSAASRASSCSSKRYLRIVNRGRCAQQAAPVRTASGAAGSSGSGSSGSDSCSSCSAHSMASLLVLQAEQPWYEGRL